MMRMVVAASILLGATTALEAGAAVPPGEDPALEARVMELASDLRCLVCQNQTLADSNADLAQELRHEIRDMMEQGRSDRAIVDFLVQRYGDFVRYRPPLRPTTILLWFGPALLLVLGGVAWASSLRKHGSHGARIGDDSDLPGGHADSLAAADEDRDERAATGPRGE